MVQLGLKKFEKKIKIKIIINYQCAVLYKIFDKFNQTRIRVKKKGKYQSLENTWISNLWSWENIKK